MISGGIQPISAVIDKEGRIVGRTTASSAVVNMEGKRIGTLMPYGTVLTTDNEYIGQTMRQGTVVDGVGQSLGVVSSDGLILKQGMDMNGRITPNGIAVGQYVKESYGTMPYIGSLAPQGLWIDFLGQVAGRSTGDGTVMDLSNAPVGTVNDYGLVLKNDGSVSGTVVPFNVAVGENCSVLGTVHPDGTVRDTQGTLKGTVTTNGLVKGSHLLQILGRVLPQGLVTDHCRVVGQPRYDGRIINARGEIVGCVNPDKSAQNMSGEKIGGLVQAGGMVITQEGELMGRVMPDGYVVGMDGVQVGCALFDGRVLDQNGTQIGCVFERGVILDENGNLVGLVQADGEVMNSMGEILGKMQCDGKAVDANGKVIGSVVTGEVLRDSTDKVIGTLSPDGQVSSAAGEPVVKVLPDGTLLNNEGEEVGKVLSDGTVVDSNGSNLGKAEDLLSEEAGEKEGTSDRKKGVRIYIDDDMFDVSDNGSILNDAGDIVGYIGDDGRPYATDGTSLVKKKAEEQKEIIKRAPPRPQKKQPQYSPEEVAQIQSLMAARRQSMKQQMQTGKIMPERRVLAKAKKKQDKDWGVGKTVSTYPVDMSRMILRDKAIPAVIVRSIDSRYPSVPVTAIVERNVYTEDGRNIIIPSGSRVIGSMSGSPGTDRVAKMEISWNRLIRPDGSAFNFQGTSGDAQGRGGVSAYLDEMFLAKYGKPILTSSIMSALTYITATDEIVTTNASDGTVAQSDRAQAAQDARENFISDMKQIFKDLIDASSSTPPVVFVPSGTRVTIFASEDLWLRSEEEDVEDLEREIGQASNAAQTPPDQYGVGDRNLPMTVQTKDGRYVPGSETYKPAQAEPVAAGTKAKIEEPVGIQDGNRPTPSSSAGRPLSLNEIYSGNQQGIVNYPIPPANQNQLVTPVLSEGDLKKANKNSPELF